MNFNCWNHDLHSFTGYANPGSIFHLVFLNLNKSRKPEEFTVERREFEIWNGSLSENNGHKRPDTLTISYDPYTPWSSMFGTSKGETKLWTNSVPSSHGNSNWSCRYLNTPNYMFWCQMANVGLLLIYEGIGLHLHADIMALLQS